MSVAARPLGKDLTVMGLIGLAHFASHFFQLVLPSLILFLKDDFGVQYAALGLIPTLLYGTSGIFQTPAGFLVDRYGARRVLLWGLTLLSVAIMATALAEAYWMLLPLAVLAGLGNSVFHPADLSILTAKVDPQRLGRAYGSHALMGNLGWAAAPVLMVGIANVADWRTAVIVAGVIGLAIVALILLFGGDMADERRPGRSSAGSENNIPILTNVRLLFSPNIVSCFLYFAFLAAALIGIQTFGPSAMTAFYGLGVDDAALALTVFLVCTAIGVGFGAVAADRTDRHDVIAIAGMALAAILVLPIALGLTPGVLIFLALGAAGLFSGVTTPSRDMLVRAAAPKGASGRVFGFVYSGLDLGSTAMPVCVGWMMDHGRPDGVFISVSVLLFCTMATVLLVRANTARPQTMAPAE